MLTPLRAVGLATLEDLEAWATICSIAGIVTEREVVVGYGEAAHVVIHRSETFEPSPALLRAGLSSRSAKPDRGPQADSPTTFDVDILAWVKWFLSASEEDGAERDAHGRFPRALSILAPADLEHVPVLDVLIGHFAETVVAHCDRSGNAYERTRPWPDGAAFAVVLSHDIDDAIEWSISTAMRKLAGAGLALARRDRPTWRRRVSEAVGLVRGPSPYWLMPRLAEMESARSFRSTFFVLPHTRRRVGEGATRVRRFDVGQPNIRRMLAGLAARGMELGLHTTYDAHEHVSGIVEDRDHLLAAVPEGVSIAGVRSHYLRLRKDITYAAEVGAGLGWDSTAGWAAGWGFRNGTSFPYRLPGRLTGEFEFWQLGLHLMDVAVPRTQLLAAASELIETVATTGGVASILIHPNPYDNATAVEHIDLYEGVLDLVGSHTAAWVATGSDVIDAMKAHRRRVVHPRQTRGAGSAT